VLSYGIAADWAIVYHRWTTNSS